jgi:hypothetical protein
MGSGTAKQLVKTPEYQAATWAVVLALVSGMAWTIGIPVAGATQQGLIFFVAFGLALLLVMTSVGLAMYALVNASRNMRPTQVRVWALTALVLDVVHLFVVIALIGWLLSPV